MKCKFDKERDGCMDKINLYVDDLRDCPEGFVVARTYYEAIHILESQEFGILTLDHDLGEDTEGNELPSGYDLVKYFCEHGLSVDKIYIHTDNPVGRENMYKTLLAAQNRGFIGEEIEIYHYPITKNKYSGN